MTKRMLIDATHDEETRVAVVDGNRLEEFEYESKFRKPLKGSIFLAKVTRVEPSLQAAFVNFGGNRHGFLPFSEIHPDYFRIPISDREALMAEQEALIAEAEEREKAREEAGEEPHDTAIIEADEADASNEPVETVEDIEDIDLDDDEVEDEEEHAEDSEGEEAGEDDADGNRRDRGRGRGRGHRGGRGRGRGRGQNFRNRTDETFEDENDVERRFRFSLRRKYKIQEVIKRGQIMLVQVSREERGNKGAAVSTYLSLPGRYCVLMPNSPRAGGVSRKIANFKDRAKMRDMLKSFEIPKSMSVIVRTAGVERTKTEIKRDLDYLMRLWDNIRELTLESTAPALVYEEADLIKRAVRDMYNKDIDDIQVAGEEGHKTAKAFMKMMIPSHVKKVILYKDDKNVPMFHKYGIENQISEIGQTSVTLKSGGYLVINPTEALVSIDVNSGRATKERHIEETALKTNLEAADEVARQLRLRDLGGLVVIDFIDMEDRRNNAKVERRMRDALSGDRARIQMGRISSFGLMEMSRQRMNPSLTESQFEKCEHCQGVGMTRTADAAAIIVLRSLEDEAMKHRDAAQMILHIPNTVAMYMLNSKRKHVTEIEERYGLSILIRVDDALGASGYKIDVVRGGEDEETESASGEELESQDCGNRDEGEGREDRGGRRGRRGGRGRRGRGRERNEDASNDDQAEQSAPQEETAAEEQTPAKAEAKNESKAESKPQSKEKDEVKEEAKADEKKDKKPARGRKKKADEKSSDDKKSEDKKAAASGKEKDSKPAKEEKPAKAQDSSSKRAEEPKADSKKIAPGQPSNDAKAAAPAVKDYETVNEPPKQKKKGWWSRG